MNFFLTMALLGGLITLGGLIYVWQWMNHRNVAKEVEELERRHAAQIFRMELLELEIDYLTRSERLKSMAAAMTNLNEVDGREQVLGFSQISDSN